jgi:hypothetical protein
LTFAVALALAGVAVTVVLAMLLATVIAYAVVPAANVIDPADSANALSDASVVDVEVEVDGLVGDEPHPCASAAVPKTPRDRMMSRRDSRWTAASVAAKSRWRPPKSS